MLPKDEEFFQAPDEGKQKSVFKFKPGHVERAVEPITKAASPRTRANQLHNDIQNKLYIYLCNKFGKAYVGTEQSTGSGTAIDVVTEKDGETTFYEIKTSPSVRTNIRQAIPQLLEYAYWPDKKQAHALVVVSHLPLTKDAKRYIAHLCTEFKLPLSYRQFDLKKMELV
jgi:hypothetical protein